MRKLDFTVGEIYHVYNRGVDKREIFLNDKDYYRFVHCLYTFNDELPALNTRHHYKAPEKNNLSSSFHLMKLNRLPLVELLVFTLMPNHYHLMLRQVKENGIARFMQKLGTGYTMYFNKKYDRTGVLFQGKFKAVHVYDQAHLIHLTHYIHTNPLELQYRGPASVTSLIDYRWSSFPDYVGTRNFPSVSNREFLLNMFGSESAYMKYTAEHLFIDNAAAENMQSVRID